MYYVGLMIANENFLCHHGVKGQRWGRRQYQHKDGSLTTLGREHYSVGEPIAASTKPKGSLVRPETEEKKGPSYYEKTHPKTDEKKEETSTKTTASTDPMASQRAASSAKGKGKKKGKGGGKGGGKTKSSGNTKGKKSRSEKIQARVDAILAKHLQKKLSEIGR